MTTSSERLDLMKEPCCCRLYHPTFVRHSLLCGSRQQSKAQPPFMAPFMYTRRMEGKSPHVDMLSQRRKRRRRHE
jgi:hypothetical protein